MLGYQSTARFHDLLEECCMLGRIYLMATTTHEHHGRCMLCERRPMSLCITTSRPSRDDDDPTSSRPTCEPPSTSLSIGGRLPSAYHRQPFLEGTHIPYHEELLRRVRQSQKRRRIPFILLGEYGMLPCYSALHSRSTPFFTYPRIHAEREGLRQMDISHTRRLFDIRDGPCYPQGIDETASADPVTFGHLVHKSTSLAIQLARGDDSLR